MDYCKLTNSLCLERFIIISRDIRFQKADSMLHIVQLLVGSLVRTVKGVSVRNLAKYDITGIEPTVQLYIYAPCDLLKDGG